MSTSAVETKTPHAVSVRVSRKTLGVKLSDGRTAPIPLDQYPRLAYATKKERANWRTIGQGHGIQWEDLDEDISVDGLLADRGSRESTESLMRWLMRRRRFNPWVGEAYGQTNGLELPAKLLLLGESHYRDRDWDEEWDGQPTIGVIREVKQQENGGYPLFTKSMRTILGPQRPTDILTRETFFDSIAFYNYVQRSVGPGPGERPTQEMWEEAAGPFRATLEDLRPTHIVACGKTLWRHMKKYQEFWTPPSETMVDWFNGFTFPNRWQPRDLLGRYCHPEGQSVLLAIHHPSRNSPSDWHPVVERFLEYPVG